MSAVINSLTLSRFYQQLDQLQQSGIPLQQAFAMVQVEGLGGVVADTARMLGQGRSLSAAGARVGWLQGMDKALLAAGERRGDYPFRQLAHWHQTRHQRLRRLSGKLFLPAGVMALALLLRPLPALVGGDLSIGGYLLASVGPMVAIGGLFAGIFWVWRKRPALRLGLLEVLSGLPLVGPLIRRRARLEFTRTLVLGHAAGLPMLEAVPLAQEVVQLPELRDQLRGLEDELSQGSTLTQAMESCKAFDSELIALVRVGEQSGRMDDVLQRHVKQREAEVDSDEEALLNWVPRVVYALLAVWMVWSLMQMGPPGSMDAIEQLDQELGLRVPPAVSLTG